MGRLYDTITNGRSTMGPYASRIAPRDRWAIVLYLKTLHETRKNAVEPEPVAEDESGEGQSADEAAAN